MELVDVLDEIGNLTGKTEDKDKIHETGIWHREVAVFIKNEKGEYLIQKRAATKKHKPNKWGLTAGHVKAGEDYETAMVREIKEELGIDVAKQDLKHIGIFKDQEEDRMTINNTFTKWYYYKTNKKISEYAICYEELSELKYILFEELEKIVETKDDKYSFSKIREIEKIIKILKNINL